LTKNRIPNNKSGYINSNHCSSHGYPHLNSKLIFNKPVPGNS